MHQYVLLLSRLSWLNGLSSVELATLVQLPQREPVLNLASALISNIHFPILLHFQVVFVLLKVSLIDILKQRILVSVQMVPLRLDQPAGILRIVAHAQLGLDALLGLPDVSWRVL